MHSPPPFRRPWSPEPRQEASDVSVEALDLADYARTLAVDKATPTSPRLTDSPSAESSNNTYYTASRHPFRRPFSLPTTASLSSHATSFQTHPLSSQSHPPSSQTHPPSARTRLHPSPRRSHRIQSPSEEIDISHFPKWSRNWYDNKPTNIVSPKSTTDPDADIYTPVPPSSFGLAGLNKNSVFDPGYKHDPSNPDPYWTYDDTRSLPLYSPVHNNNSTRNLLPWSSDSPQYEPPLEPALKEERMRMLEKEFGDKSLAKASKKHDPLVDENGKPVVGTIDSQGRLVTVGPRKRIFIRVLQILLALTAGVPSIYVALVGLPSLLSNFQLIQYLLSGNQIFKSTATR